MTREEFDKIMDGAWKRWQNGKIGLGDCIWAAFYGPLNAAPQPDPCLHSDREAGTKTGGNTQAAVAALGMAEMLAVRYPCTICGKPSDGHSHTITTSVPMKRYVSFGWLPHAYIKLASEEQQSGSLRGYVVFCVWKWSLMLSMKWLGK